jgi:tRNA(Ile)-lysidine synthase
MATMDPVSTGEAAKLFADLADKPALVLAVSGGPDSTALMLLAARWRAARKQAPRLLAVTIDHGLRSASAQEAKDVKRLARKLGVEHRTMRWRGSKPTTRLQERARLARYQLLVEAARRIGAAHIVTAHTLDDQAETVLLRLCHGSGLAGLAGMAPVSPVPLPPPSAGVGTRVSLVRPFLDIPKARLVATLRAARVPFAEDPSNVETRFTRARLRGVMPALAAEGLDAKRLALLARRVARAEAALGAAVDAARAQLARQTEEGGIALDPREYCGLPDEVALRLLGRAIALVGSEGPVELGKLEALFEDLQSRMRQPRRSARFRRTLAGAIVSLAPDKLTIERAPPRRGGKRVVTTRSPQSKKVPGRP